MTALLTIDDKWVRAANERKLVGVLCMDLTAAFDLVDSNILIEKLKELDNSKLCEFCIKRCAEWRKMTAVN